jgi:hypothetical protein
VTWWGREGLDEKGHRRVVLPCYVRFGDPCRVCCAGLGTKRMQGDHGDEGVLNIAGWVCRACVWSTGPASSVLL